MADTDLGVLRRAPRPLEQRLERIARWRAQGLANGAADSTFPSDATDSVIFASGGDATVSTGGDGGGSVTKWVADSFNLTAGTLNEFALTAQPLASSEVLRINGLVFEPTEYSIAGSTLTLTDIAAARLGIGADTWRLVVNYAYVDLATPGTSEGTVLELGPWGYWKLDETSAVSEAQDILDSSGNNRHGGFGTGIATLDQPPLAPGLSRSMYLDGLSDKRLYIDHDMVGFEDGYTVSAWVKPMSLTAGLGTPVIAHSASDSGTWLFRLGINAGAWSIQEKFDLFTQEAAGGTPVVGQVYHVATVWDGAVLTLKVNNVVVGTYTPVAFATPMTRRGITLFGRTATIGGGNFWTGYVSDVAVWDRPLSDAELTTVYGGGLADPVVAVPDGTYTPPTPPATPGSTLLRYQKPDTTGWDTLVIGASGGTFTLDQTKDWYITTSAVVTEPVTIIGGRNIVVYGMIRDFPTTVPTGDYDAARRGLRFKDGPNPDVKRVIYVEGLYLRTGYYSDGIQLAIRYENDVTLIVQALRADAIGYGQRSGVHSDLIQFYGGPLNFFGDTITAKGCTYQGIFMRPLDNRPAPSGEDKVAWQLSRTNIESSSLTGGAHYLLYDVSPSFTGLTLDKVYITGAPDYDVTDGTGNIPSSGLFQNATPPGGDWAPASWWTGSTYTSPGYV